MIEGLSSYPSLRDLEFKWIPNVPSHWGFLRAKNLFVEVNERSRAGAETLLSVSHKTGVTPRSQKNVNMFMAESLDGYKVCRRNDVVVNTMWAWMAAMGVSNQVGIVSPSYAVYRLRDSGRLLSAYLERLLRTPLYRNEYYVRSTGITDSRLRLYPEDFLRIPFIVPPPEEQTAIVKFLDHADRRIRRYIKAKQKLIKLLEEQKQVIIHNAVTKGLDPNAKMKPSGVEWLGEVPAHWEVLSLGRLVRRIEQGWSPNAAQGRLEDEQWAVTSLSCVNRGAFVTTALKPIALTSQVPGHLELKDGNFLMTRSNNRERVGDVCIVAEVRRKTIFSDLIYRLTLCDEVYAPFLAQFLLSRAGRDQIEISAQGSSGTMPKLSHQRIRSIRCTLPPSTEQHAIAMDLERRVAVIENTKNNAKRELALLSEYRTRLIADVVTGKLDVRDAAAKLPDLTPDHDLPDPDDDLTDDDPDADADTHADL